MAPTLAEPSPASEGNMPDPGPIQGTPSGAKADRSFNHLLLSNGDLAVPQGDWQP